MHNSKVLHGTKSSEKSESLWWLEEVRFYCSWEWHFAWLTSRFAPLLYSWGRGLSFKNNTFYASVDNIAKHFCRDRTTVMRALEELQVYGWVEVLHKEPGKPVTYRFIDHEEWARAHPDECRVKDKMPWEGEGDPLGRQLHAISGGQAKFYPNQMTGLRKSGLSDDEIAIEFRVFLDRNPQTGKMWKSVYYRFRRHLFAVAADIRKAADAKNSSSRVSHGSDTYQSRTCDTPCRTEATLTSRAGATQVLEVEFPKEDSNGRLDTASGRVEADSAHHSLPEIHGRGKPPSKPSPENIPLRRVAPVVR